MSDNEKSYITDDGEAMELDAAFFAGAKRGRPAMPESEKKTRVNIFLDKDVLAHFKATGPGWQTRVNEKLREALE